MENENYQFQDSSIILANNQMNHKQFGSALQQMDNCLEYFQRYYIEQPSFKKKEIEVNFLLMWGQLQFSRSFCHYSLSDLPQAELFIQSALRINFSTDFLLLYAAILHKQQNYARLHQITQILLLCPCNTLSNTTVAPLKCINLLSGLFLNRFQHEDAQFLADLLSKNEQSDYSLLCTFSLIKFFEALEQRLLEPPLPLLQSVQNIFELKTKNLAQILSQLFVLFTKFEGTNEIYQKLNQFEWLLFNQLKISTELKTTKYSYGRWNCFFLFTM
ncbi:Tetratricopeptide-like_helical domain superfamily [Hexamita inflata]|uniref:Tetratricopeptide-like helical domain superfamily n=1 Tax=Hexamita inflata TaxID=28002 RepID=A0AA86UDF2_9EUKA|nr:Tetratricopeptide-like helical domain superfamily [Hexamita inflata]